MFEALIEYVAKKLIDIGFKKTTEAKNIETKKINYLEKLDVQLLASGFVNTDTPEWMII